MIRNTFFAVLGMLALATASQAAVMVNSVKGTTALAGYSLYTLTAVSDNEAQPILGFDFAGNPDNNDPATGLGFFGAMSQVNPFAPTFSTVFMDNNALFPNTNPLRQVNEDSQFLFSTTDPSVVVSTPASQEGSDILQASFVFADPKGLSVPFAQLVIPDAATGAVNFRGSALVGASGQGVNVALAGCVGTCGSVPVLPTVGNLSLVANDLNEVVSDTVALTDVATLAFDNVNTPAFVPLIPLKPLELGQLPTLDNAGNFSWNTAGSKRGLYTWSITGTNPDGSDGGMISVEVTQIPEPATLSLFGLALVGFIGFARKRS